MKALRVRARQESVWLLSRAYPRSLAAGERILQESQGKGWGSASIAAEVKAFHGLLDRAGIVRPVVFDVGANQGDWTEALLLRQPLARTVAFEPSAQSFRTLKERFADDERVIATNIALSDFAGDGFLWSDAPGSQLASLTKRSLDLMGSGFDFSEPVSVQTLDDWSAASGIQPDGIKLDVEGKELAILACAENVLRSVAVVQFEFGGTQIDQRLFLADYYRFLTARGFRLARLSPSGLTHLATYEEADEVFRPTNFFAYRR